MFKNFKLYLAYRKVLKENSKELLDIFKLQIDAVDRLYTVINLDPKLVEKYYTEDLSGPTIREFLGKVDRYMTAKGLMELVGIRKITKVDDFNYLVVLGFTLFDTSKFYKRLIYLSIFSIISTIIAIILV